MPSRKGDQPRKRARRSERNGIKEVDRANVEVTARAARAALDQATLDVVKRESRMARVRAFLRSHGFRDRSK